MRVLAILVAASLWMCIDCNAHASIADDAIKACAPYRTIIDRASLYGPSPSLLTAVIFAESSCDERATHRRTGAIGLGQILPSGSAAGNFTAAEIRDPWLNVLLTAGHLNLWRIRCGNWLGAVEVFGGRKHCRIRSKQGAKIVTLWRAIQKRMEVRV